MRYARTILTMGELSNHLDKTIFIASSSLDEGSWRPVASILEDRGYSVIAYEADKVASGQVSLDIRITNDQGFSARYDGHELAINGINAAWYRRPTMFADEQADKAKQLTLDTERRKAQYQLWASIPEEVWLSSPSRMQHAEHKLTQLALAQEIGFAIPDTVVANTWEPITKELPDEIIYKPSFGMVYDAEGLKLVYTTPFANNPDSLPLEGNPFPGFWQPFLRKAREWRITVVGDEAFDAAIYTADDAKDDWRKHQLGARIEFKHEPFPNTQKEKCFEYLSRMGLGFGAFDFVEDYDGKVTFLECNANGQFGWLEDELGFPISKAIATELGRIAK